MAIPKSEKIWFNGNFVKWEDAKIHVMSHVVNYGSSVFEGIRCYNTAKGSAVFCLQQHVQRLMNSAKIYRMDVPYSAKEVRQAILETIRENKMRECYIRPVIFRGYGEIGVSPLGCPEDVVAAENLLLAAFQSDAGPLLRQVRRELNLHPDPLTAYLESEPRFIFETSYAEGPNRAVRAETDSASARAAGEPRFGL